MPSVKSDELVITRGRGAYVWDADGRRLLDAPASLWYCNVGHGRTEIAAAVAAQMGEIEAYSTFGRFTTRPPLELAQRLAELAPLDDAKVFFGNGGSDAVEAAVKLARRYWAAVDEPRRQIVVSRELSYHGLHGFGTSVTGIETNRDGFGDLLPDAARVATNDAESLARLLETRGDEVAAFLCEPIIGTGGVIPPEPDYLRDVQELCRKYGVLFVVDEVITGFGRTGRWFASDRYDLRPDILLFAKGVTSGYLPLGGMLVGGHVARPFWDDDSTEIFRHGLTYAGHAAACAAALANLDILEHEQLVERVDALAPSFRTAMESLNGRKDVVAVRVGDGLLAGIQLSDPQRADAVARTCLEHGVVMRVITNGTLQISPPFVIDEDDIAAIVAAVERSLN